MAADLAIKEPVRVATTGNIARSGLQTIDGVAVAAGDRVLVRAQTNTTENGIYVAASGSWTRATDFDAAGEVTGGTQVFVTEGTLFGEGFWHVAGSAAVTPGGAITFEPEFLQTGTGSVPRTLQNKARDLLSLRDKGIQPDMDAALAAAVGDLPNGGDIFIPRGNWTLTSTYTFAESQLNIFGEGDIVSIVNFDPASPDIAWEFDDGAGIGAQLFTVRKLGFASGNDVAKTALNLINAANCDIEHVTVLASAWGGDSIGIRTEGRQVVRIRDCSIGCARPIVFAPNSAHPTLSTDHYLLESCELTGSSASRPVIELENGVLSTNLTIRNTALVGGRDGIRWVDSSSAGASYNMHLQDLRTEQGIAITPSIGGITKANPAVVTTSAAHGLETGDVVTISGVGGMTQLNGNSYTITVTGSTTFALNGVNSSGYGTYTSGGTATSYGYAIRLASSARDLQTLLVENAYLGRNQNGVYLRRVKYATFVNCTFDQVGGVSVDIELATGAQVEFINCLYGQNNGTFRITNGKCVRRYADSRTLTFSETWVYDANGQSGMEVSETGRGGIPQLIANNTSVKICDDVYCGFVTFVTSEDLGAEYFIAGGSHTVSERDDIGGFFTTTFNNPNTLNVYWDSGTSSYRLQNLRGTATTVAIQLRSGLTGY